MITKPNAARSVRECSGGHAHLVAGFAPKAFRLELQRAAPRRSALELIQQGRAEIAGPIRQEILSGIREPERYRKILNELRDYPEPALGVTDYEEAARMSNLCRARGVSGQPTDFLICAIAQQRSWKIFTTDRDFENYRKAIPVSFYVPS